MGLPTQQDRGPKEKRNEAGDILPVFKGMADVWVPQSLEAGLLSTAPHKWTYSLALGGPGKRSGKRDLGGRRNERLLATQASSSHSGMLCKGKTIHCLFSLSSEGTWSSLSLPSKFCLSAIPLYKHGGSYRSFGPLCWATAGMIWWPWGATGIKALCLVTVPGTSEKSGVPPKAYLGLCIKDNWKMSLPVEIFVLDLNLLSEVSEFLLFGELSSQLF